MSAHGPRCSWASVCVKERPGVHSKPSQPHFSLASSEIGDPGWHLPQPLGTAVGIGGGLARAPSRGTGAALARVWLGSARGGSLCPGTHPGLAQLGPGPRGGKGTHLICPLTPACPQHQEQHSEGRSAPSSEPHLIFVYEDRQILEDAAALVSYYVKRQPAIQKEDQGTIQQLLHRFLPSLFFSQQPQPQPQPQPQAAPAPGPDEPAEERERERDGPAGPGAEPAERRKPAGPGAAAGPGGGAEDAGPGGDAGARPPRALDDVYSLFFANNNWYFFLRLHQTLCSRLLKIYRQAQKQLLEYRAEKEREQLLCAGRREKGGDPAMELRLKQPSEPAPAPRLPPSGAGGAAPVPLGGGECA